MVQKSNVDIAYDIVASSESPISFASLWQKICEVNGYSEEESAKRISNFYTTLLLDGRFVNLGNNTWDIRSRYAFNQIKLDVNDCYYEDDDGEVDPEENDGDEDSEEESSEEESDNDSYEE